MFTEAAKIPKRILMTADAVGGVWTYALDLARALEPYNVEIALAVMGGAIDSDKIETARRISNINLFKSEYKLEWMANPWRDVKAAGEWLLSLERRLKPDIVHLNNFAHGSLIFNAPKLVVGHSCVLSWWRAVKDEDAPDVWKTYKDKISKGLQSANLVIAPTKAMLDALEKHYGFLPNKRVIPNGRDENLFQSGEKRKIVLSAGRLWDEAKNIATLARIAPRLSWQVFVAGEDKHPDGDIKIFENVKSLGRLSPETLAGWFSRAAIYALPARYEPFGLSALEAALSGCALVLGDIPSFREIWRDAALFVKGDDELEAALKNLIENSALREEMSKRARIRARNFDLKKIAKNYLTAYADLMNGKTLNERRERSICAL